MGTASELDKTAQEVHVLAALDQAVMALDAGGTITYANPAASRMLHTHGAVLGRTLASFVEIDHRPAVHAALRRACAGYPVRRHECCIGTIGACHWIELDAAPAADGCVVIARDLQERNTVRAVLEEQRDDWQDTLAGVLDTIPVGIVIADGHGAPRLANRAARDLLGMHALTPLHQWFSTGMLRRVDGSPVTSEDVPAALTLDDGIARRDIELQVVRPWGEAVPVLMSTDAVLDPDGRVVEVCCTLTNIHARRHIERQLQQAQKMEAIGTLAGGIAHDFNNILCAISGYSELALLQEDLGERGRGVLHEIKKASDRAATLTRRLLSFSRMDKPAPRAMQLNAVVRDMGPILRRLIGRDVEMHVDLSAGIAHIQADPAQVEQVLLNLVINARDAMPNGGPLEIRTAGVTLPDPGGAHTVRAPAGSYAVLTVRDEGAGMDADTLARVFEPFYTTKAPDKGTGLGLSTVYAVVKQSRGAIDVSSRPGEGTTFRVYLPCAQAEVLPDRLTPSSVSDTTRGRETILVVEDEPLVRSLIREILEACGYAVIDASNGREALGRAERSATPAQLLVTDVVMPQMGGPELAARLRRAQEDLKVLFVSGYAHDTLQDTGALAGATDFLPKPFDAATLSSKVRSLLDVVPV